ncbi:MAG: hypothetical protein HXX13_04155 [Bacteroidetes bacterium]|nr:hypothetical protein [Bacteroidota bacterium]
MQNITSVSDLKIAIQLLEVEQELKEQQLKEQVHFTYESLKPVNILRNTLHDLISSPSLVDDVLGTSLGLASGFLSKKIVIGTSANILRKIAGYVLQFFVTNTVSQHPDALKSLGKYIMEHLFRKKEMNSDKR